LSLEQSLNSGPLLAVIVPTLNERDNVEPLLAALDSSLKDWAYEVIFVDDWSSDGTAEAIQMIATGRRNVKVIRRFGRSGLSSAVMEGFLSTTATICAVIDADRQHDEALVPKLAALVARGDADIAVGSRYLADGSTGDWSGERAAASRFATRLASHLLPPSLTDPMSGLFAVRRSVFEAALPQMSATGFKILLDIVLSSPTPPQIAELPYHFRARIAGESKLDAGVVIEYLLLVIDKSFKKFAPPRLIMFGFVGLMGVAVHLGVLRSGMDGLGLSFPRAQALAVTGAIGFNFTVNNVLTFRDRRLRGLHWWLGLASFYLVCGLGAVANVGVGSLVFSKDHRWWLAGLAGAAVGSIWNFAASSYVTWRKR
jgi:dolichol-phosphate mannosyltransferase